MSMCQQCKGEMMEGISCLSGPISMCGGLFDPIRWGDEKESARWVIDFPCRDCGTPIGGVHHPGCCVERCPACLGQAFGCPCFGDLDDGEDEDDYCGTMSAHGGVGSDGVVGVGSDGAGRDLAGHVRISTRCRTHLYLRHFRR